MHNDQDIRARIEMDKFTPEEARSIVLRNIDRALNALTELHALAPTANPSNMLAAEWESHGILEQIERVAEALDA